MINKVNKKEVMDAIDYFWQCEDVECDSDRIYYLKILLKKVANIYGVELID